MENAISNAALLDKQRCVKNMFLLHRQWLVSRRTRQQLLQGQERISFSPLTNTTCFCSLLLGMKWRFFVLPTTVVQPRTHGCASIMGGVETVSLKNTSLVQLQVVAWLSTHSELEKRVLAQWKTKEPVKNLTLA